MSDRPSISIRQVERFAFRVEFGPAFETLLTDEPVPIGDGLGPSPEQVLIAAVSNCLCASFVFALGKFHQDGGGVSAQASGRLGRNAEGRLRLEGIDVAIALGAEAASMDRIDRVLEQFERFCTVSESVKAGIPVSVSVQDGAGTRLK
ncbi:peroxiredoxin [Methylobacterium sp. Leaf456]|uniref:OsmC family protein n=1 Tax=Methylobacterium sp. Leaf456 TaxID=1736382 RepID=UPI0006FA59F5|nr:OsmC family protein [Methylobacterium sp. Leaf456]KQT46698.1 peroxiredoxin [Methylobacterium sp. Leaf456]